MNWDAIGAIGEIIGALAVFITLVYLAIQIRQNTRAVHSSAWGSTVNVISIARQSIYENDDVAKVYLTGLATPEQLDDLGRLKFRLLLHNLMLSHSNTFAQTKFSDLPNFLPAKTGWICSTHSYSGLPVSLDWLRPHPDAHKLQAGEGSDLL